MILWHENQFDQARPDQTLHYEEVSRCMGNRVLLLLPIHACQTLTRFLPTQVVKAYEEIDDKKYRQMRSADSAYREWAILFFPLVCCF